VDELIHVPLALDGPHYLEVRAYGGAVNDYSMVVTP
jgi:hypothetical protein